MNKKILILGTNSGQLDLIKAMKRMGWYIIACSNRSNEIGVTYTDEFFEVDIRDIDAVVDLAAQNEVDLVYSVSSDTAMTTAVKVAQILNLPIFYDEQFITLLDNKEDLRRFLNNANLSYVEYIEVQSKQDNYNWVVYPCIVKPSNAQGQRGVQKVSNKQELQNAIKKAQQYSSSNTAIIEEFLDGVEMSCNVLVCKGKVIFDVLSERLTYSKGYFGIPIGHLIPCVNVQESVQKEAIELVHKIIKKLDIDNGPLYFQMKATKKGVKVIEIAPRLDGCHMWRLIEYATGRNFLMETIDVLLDNHNDSSHVELKDNKNYELIFQHGLPNNTFIETNFPIPIDAFYHEYRYNNGEIINIINGEKEVVGYYIAAFDKDKWELK